MKKEVVTEGTTFLRRTGVICDACISENNKSAENADG